MQTRLHAATEPGACSFAIRRNVDDVLVLRMIQQKSVYRFVLPAGEVLAEPFYVKAARTVPALENSAHEPDLAIVGKQIDYFLVQTLVKIVAVAVLQLPDSLFVLKDSELQGQLIDFFLKRLESSIVAHNRFSFMEALG